MPIIGLIGNVGLALLASVRFTVAASKANAFKKTAGTYVPSEGPDGFTGGLSVKNYLSITSASRATATPDLQDLVEKNILTRTGGLKGTSYS